MRPRISIRGCVRPSVRPSVGPSVGPSIRRSVRPSVGPSVRWSVRNPFFSMLEDVCFSIAFARIIHREHDTEQVGGDGVGCGDGVGGVVGCTGQKFVRIHG